MDQLALYFHWPFCLAKCPYCDFNSHVRESLPQADMLAALQAELGYEAARLGRREVGSIFFGGGTPSLMDPESVAALIQEAGRVFRLAPEAEITLEANPTSVEAAKFQAYRQAGVNRVSIGVQSFEIEALRFLGRQHSAQQAIAAIELGAKIFPRISFDLIYARPGQSQAAWRSELRQALDLAADHLSLYQLTIEDGTKFATLHARGEFTLPDEDEAEALYDITAEEAGRYGLQRYEVSNYAKPGGESRHNMTYWRYGDYAGIGPGAHGRLSLGGRLLATTRHRAPEPWMERVAAHGHGTTLEEDIPAQDRAREALIMGLRLREGIAAPHFAARTGIALLEAIEPEILDECLAEGYLTFAEDRLAATAQGIKRLDALLPALCR
ncbi:radical SAM family heme chaperone HemW [Acidocella facilis]|uniref:radical SAM family heme chaperone HemW n=1 Tax=Acidocella facilis TaxID=525 RepID=UPI001F20089E|nr:radical SAM family heme chaperone HemW [Acidocella facilis]